MTGHLCPLWREPLYIDPLPAGDSYLIYSPRAGGVYRLEGSWADFVRHPVSNEVFTRATPRQKANLSHWIYRQNLEAGLLLPDRPTGLQRHTVMAMVPKAELAQLAPTLDEDTVQKQYQITPKATACLFYLMHEMLRQQGSPLHGDQERLSLTYGDYQGFRRAAAAVASTSEETEFREYIKAQAWATFPRSTSYHAPHGEAVFPPAVCSMEARLWVEEQLGERGTGQQGFIALWFNKTVREKVSPAIEGAIQDAGYTPLLIDRDLRTHSIPDQVVHQLRQSRFVVADLTSHRLDDTDELGRRNVYYEAGFAAGAGLEVIFTCRKNCYDEKKVASDIRHFHVVLWDGQSLESFRQELQERILARVRSGRDYVGVNAVDN